MVGFFPYHSTKNCTTLMTYISSYFRVSPPDYTCGVAIKLKPVAKASEYSRTIFQEATLEACDNCKAMMKHARIVYNDWYHQGLFATYILFLVMLTICVRQEDYDDSTTLRTLRRLIIWLRATRCTIWYQHISWQVSYEANTSTASDAESTPQNRSMHIREQVVAREEDPLFLVSHPTGFTL